MTTPTRTQCNRRLTLTSTTRSRKHLPQTEMQPRTVVPPHHLGHQHDIVLEVYTQTRTGWTSQHFYPPSTRTQSKNQRHTIPPGNVNHLNQGNDIPFLQTISTPEKGRHETRYLDCPTNCCPSRCMESYKKNPL